MKKKLMGTALVAGTLLTSTLGANAASLTFNDVPQSSSYASYIYDLVGKGVLVGKTISTFGPQDSLKRSEFATMLVQAFGLKFSSKPVHFPDAKTSWASMYIETAYEAGLISGTSPTTFSPNDPLTREQAAAMVWRYLSAHGVTDNSTSVTLSGSHSDWATSALENVMAYQLYAPQEVSNGDYIAGATMTREQAAALIDLALIKVKTTGTITINPTGTNTSTGTTPTKVGNGSSGFPQPVVNWVETPLVKNSDGSSSPNSPQMPSIITSQYTASQMQGFEDIFNKAKFMFTSTSCTVTVPSTGVDNYWWILQDDKANEWEGEGPKTMTFTPNKGVEVSLFNHDNAKAMVQFTLFNNNGQWTAKILNSSH